MDAFLKQIQPQSALQLITQLRQHTDPPGATFVSDLDDHIASAIPSKLIHSNGESTLNKGDVIEIQGPAASGKTQLLHFFAMTCVLPFNVSVSSTTSLLSESPHMVEVMLGGRSKSVVIFDCDGRWRMSRLQSILSSYISNKFAQTFQDQTEGEMAQDLQLKPSVEEVVTACLRRIHIFRPTSSMSLATTLLALPAYHRKSMWDQEILMLFIDSLSAFYHADRWKADEAKLLSEADAKVSNEAALPRADLRPMDHVISSLQTLRSTLGIITFITNWALIALDGKSVNSHPFDNAKPYYGQHLLPPYPHIALSEQEASASENTFQITHHITLPGTESAIAPFPMDITLSDALQDEERRGVVEDGGVTAVVRTQPSCSGDGGGGSEEELRAIAVGSFEFAIRGYSIGVE